jgi:hypothetical protein
VLVSGLVASDSTALSLLAVASVFTVNNLVAFLARTCVGVVIGRLPRSGPGGRKAEAAAPVALLAVAACLAH